jgi:hypothetical protein
MSKKKKNMTSSGHESRCFASFQGLGRDLASYSRLSAPPSIKCSFPPGSLVDAFISCEVP